MFTRAQLLQEVWGYDFFGGTRTVDVHVRRLRAKLGTEHEQMIGTVRNVGYKFVRPSRGGLGVPAGSIVEDDGEDGDDGERARARVNGVAAYLVEPRRVRRMSELVWRAGLDEAEIDAVRALAAAATAADEVAPLGEHVLLHLGRRGGTGNPAEAAHLLAHDGCG